MAVPGAKPAEQLRKRNRLQTSLDQARLTISKTGGVVPGTTLDQAPKQPNVEVARAKHQVYYQRLQESLARAFADRQFYRMITDD